MDYWNWNYGITVSCAYMMSVEDWGYHFATCGAYWEYGRLNICLLSFWSFWMDVLSKPIYLKLFILRNYIRRSNKKVFLFKKLQNLSIDNLWKQTMRTSRVRISRLLQRLYCTTCTSLYLYYMIKGRNWLKILNICLYQVFLCNSTERPPFNLNWFWFNFFVSWKM